ncbi:hypothetical protein L9F63_004609, partial [Diploptera punctata]
SCKEIIHQQRRRLQKPGMSGVIIYSVGRILFAIVYWAHRMKYRYQRRMLMRTKCFYTLKNILVMVDNNMNIMCWM